MPTLNRLGSVVAHASDDGREGVEVAVTTGLSEVGEIASTAVNDGTIVGVAIVFVVVGAIVIVTDIGDGLTASVILLLLVSFATIGAWTTEQPRTAINIRIARRTSVMINLNKS